jgi:3-polyprenyl-4-hydroxybenzoate decarboxylase
MKKLVEQLKEHLLSNGWKKESEVFFTKNTRRREASLSFHSKNIIIFFVREYPLSEGWFETKDSLTKKNLNIWKKRVSFF